MNNFVDQLIAISNDKVPAHIEFRLLPAPNSYLNDELEIRMEDNSVKIIIEYKSDPRLMHLPYLIARNDDCGPIILAATHIGTTVKDELRKSNINYFDISGNMYISLDHFFIHIDGQKRVKLIDENKGRAFTKTGLKVVFAFLMDSELINLPYRNISEKLSVSLDTVHNVISGLKRLGYIMSMTERKIKLINVPSLIMRWTQEFDSKLKPDLFIGRFRFANPGMMNSWEEIDLNPNQTQWGGEPAGALMTSFLRPSEFTLYTSLKKADAMKQSKLLPDPDGNIKLYRKFWLDGEVLNKFVPELLVYADLINHGDSRNADIANKIYEQHLQSKFK